MKLSDLKNIQPILTGEEFELLKKAGHIHEDPNIYINPDRMRMVTRLMKMGLLQQIRDPNVIKYQVTEKGKQFTK